MKYYNPFEMTSILNIKPEKIIQCILTGELKCIRMGANYRVSEDELSKFIHKYNKRLAHNN